MDTYDYVVVGAGHNGLSAACTLGEAGRSVLLVDQLPFYGGLSTSRAWVPQAPNHLLSVGAMDDMTMAQTPLTEELGLKSHGYRPVALEAPYGWIDEEGNTLLLFRDFDRTVRDIQRYSPKDAKTYRDIKPMLDLIMDQVEYLASHHPSAVTKKQILKAALRVASNKTSRALLTSMLQLSVFELIAETFESDPMQGLWAYWTSMVGPADADGTGAFLMAFHATHRKQGVLRPVGGMTGLMDAFVSKIKSHGGEIRLDDGVEQIIVENGRALGVRTRSGAEFHARYGVLSTAAPQYTLGRMLPQGALDRRTQHKVSLIPANAVNSAAFKIDIANGGRFEYPAAAKKRTDGFDVRKTTLMTGTLAEHIAHLKALKLGLKVAKPPVYMSVLSAADDTLAPAGQDLLYLHSNVPADPAGGMWDEAVKADYENEIVESSKRFLSGFEHEIGRVVHSPKDFEDNWGTPKGAYFHVDMNPGRLGINRPARGLGGYVTPVDGLYLGGAGTHPGGTITGWCGRLSAQTALEHESAPTSAPRPTTLAAARD